MKSLVDTLSHSLVLPGKALYNGKDLKIFGEAERSVEH